MFHKFLRNIVLSATAVLLVSGAAITVQAHDMEDALIKDGKFYADFCYRYEYVDQDGFDNNANASTLRAKIGYKIRVYRDFQALLEAEISGNLDKEDYNDTVNGKTPFVEAALQALCYLHREAIREDLAEIAHVIQAPIEQSVNVNGGYADCVPSVKDNLKQHYVLKRFEQFDTLQKDQLIREIDRIGQTELDNMKLDDVYVT